MRPSQEFPSRSLGQVRTAYQPRSTGFELARSEEALHHRFLACTVPSRSPSPTHPVVLGRPDFVAAAPTLPGVSRLKLPPASPTCHDRSAAESFHLRSKQQRLVAHHKESDRPAVGQSPAIARALRTHSLAYGDGYEHVHKEKRPMSALAVHNYLGALQVRSGIRTSTHHAAVVRREHRDDCTVPSLATKLGGSRHSAGELDSRDISEWLQPPHAAYPGPLRGSRAETHARRSIVS